ncbi:hypothetical protein IAT38_007713 [Cryptococcus sp. DSM 104549]
MGIPAPLSRLSPTALIITLSISVRLLQLLVLHILPSFLPLFDTSPLLLSPNPSPGLRWDAIHFASIATRGYEYEQQLAFQPGWLGVMRLAGEAVRWVKSSMGLGATAAVEVQDVVLGGMIVGNVAYVLATFVLYKLTLHMFNPTFALLTALFYTLPPTASSTAPYTEPLCALLTFSGYYLVIKKQYLLGGICLSAATSMRASGLISLAAVMGWAVYGEDRERNLGMFQSAKRLLYRALRPAIPTLIAFAPFLAFQVYAEKSFCSPADKAAGVARPWCYNPAPISYGFVQNRYWNVGPFNYWTLEQLPNIMLALPIIIASLLGTLRCLSIMTNPTPTLDALGETVRPHPALYDFTIGHFITMILLIVSSHTQIALRVCTGDPVLWWHVTQLAVDWEGVRAGKGLKVSKLGRWWLGWTVVWGAVAIVLWAGHYPPA